MYYNTIFSVYSGHGGFVYRNVLVWVGEGESIDTAIKRDYNLKKVLSVSIDIWFFSLSKNKRG